MPTRITIAEHDRAPRERTASSNPPDRAVGGTARAFTPSGGSGSALDLFTPKGSASSPTPRFGLTRQAAKTLSSKNIGAGAGVGDDGRSATKSKDVSSRPAPRQANNGDIVASPRLLGYLLNFIASLICMVSAIKFERLSQQHSWFDLLVYFSDGRIDHNSTTSSLAMNRSSSNSTRLLLATAPHEEQQIFAEGAVPLSIYEASMLYDVAVIVGGPETRLFNPHGVRLLQVDESGYEDYQASELSPPTFNPSPLENPETSAPMNGPAAPSELVTDVPTLLGIDSSTGPTPAPTMIGNGPNESVGNISSSSPTASVVNDTSSAAPTLIPTASNLTAISPIIDEKLRPIRAVDYWVCWNVFTFIRNTDIYISACFECLALSKKIALCT